MDSLVRKIEGFLETKKISWIERRVYDSAKAIYIPAVDKDFLDQSFQKVVLRNAQGKTYHKLLVATEKLFLVFDSKLKGLEKDLSYDWKVYQTKIDKMRSVEGSRGENFHKYLDEEKYDK